MAERNLTVPVAAVSLVVGLVFGYLLGRGGRDEELVLARPVAAPIGPPGGTFTAPEVEQGSGLRLAQPGDPLVGVEPGSEVDSSEPDATEIEEGAAALSPAARRRRVNELFAQADGWFERGEGPQALAALKELARLVPEGRGPAMDLAIRINADVEGDGKLGLSQMTYYPALGDPAVVDLMVWSFDNESPPSFRTISAYSLPWVKGEETTGILARALADETDPSVQQALVWNLVRQRDAAANEALVATMKDSSRDVALRTSIATMLTETPSAELRRTYESLALSDPDPEVRKAASTALRILDPPATGFLVTGTLPGSQAETAGMQSGDVVVSYGGRTVRTLDELKAARAATETEEAVRIVVVRGNAEVELTLRPGQMGVFGRDVVAR